MKLIIHTLIIDHKHGQDTHLFLTNEQRQVELHQWLKDNWEDVSWHCDCPNIIPEDTEVAFEEYKEISDFRMGDATYFYLEEIGIEVPEPKTEEQKLQEFINDHGGIWGSHHDHSVEDWQHEVSNNNTRLGYWQWVSSQLEQEEL